ncbi:MAG: hypothetical protein DLM63_06170 [Solirubrobacterales bacterium]|nr:MAG: hypothetical protein DLM63_06170 [Solirubrobacterales bacterium]
MAEEDSWLALSARLSGIPPPSNATGAFERNSAVLDATLERLGRSEEDHRLFMREMILRRLA